MERTVRLSQTAARQVMLAAMGLSQPPQASATQESVLDAIRRMGALQIDTIHVVARSPYLVLWSRLGDYPPAWLDEWLAEGALFEYWAHEACFLPIEDWPLYRRLMLDGVKDRRSTNLVECAHDALSFAVSGVRTQLHQSVGSKPTF